MAAGNWGGRHCSQWAGQQEMTSWGHFSCSGIILGPGQRRVWGLSWEGVRAQRPGQVGDPVPGLNSQRELGGCLSVLPSPVAPCPPLPSQEQPAMATHLLRLPVPAAHCLQHAETHLQDALQGGRPGECSRAPACPAPASSLPSSLLASALRGVCAGRRPPGFLSWPCSSRAPIHIK